VIIFLEKYHPEFYFQKSNVFTAWITYEAGGVGSSVASHPPKEQKIYGSNPATVYRFKHFSAVIGSSMLCYCQCLREINVK
jgi:hypothetical protein